jgi:hypothetical protein
MILDFVTFIYGILPKSQSHYEGGKRREGQSLVGGLRVGSKQEAAQS